MPPVLRPLTGIVFDLDGTLVDSAPDICNALNEFLANRQRRAVTVPETQTALGDGATKLVERILTLTGGCPVNFTSEVHDFIEIYRNITADPAQLYPGAIALLQELRARNVALGLCTNKPFVATQKLLTDLALLPYFAGVTGGDSLPVHKPDPAHLRGTIALMGVAEADCVMVGDSPNDFLAAQGLGLPCIMVDYGYGAASSALPAAATISALPELPETLLRLGYRF